MNDHILYDVKIDEGKYQFIYFKDGKCQAYRYRERWTPMEQDMIGNKAILGLVARISELEEFQEKAFQAHPNLDLDIEALTH